MSDTSIVTRGWTKLDSGIVNSTLWMKDDASLRVWIALLSSCDSGGYARVSVPAMAHLCRIDIPEFERIIDDFCSPDPYSRCQDDDGRRLRRVEGGFVVLSYLRYRAMKTRAQTPAERKEAQRERDRAEALVTKSHECHEAHNVTPDTDTDTDTYTDTDKNLPSSNEDDDDFNTFWNEYPRKVGKQDARKAWKQTSAERPPIEEIVSRLETCCRSASWLKEGGKFIPYPATWVRRHGWHDEMAPAGAEGNQKKRKLDRVSAVTLVASMERLTEDEVDELTKVIAKGSDNEAIEALNRARGLDYWRDPNNSDGRTLKI